MNEILRQHLMAYREELRRRISELQQADTHEIKVLRERIKALDEEKKVLKQKLKQARSKATDKKQILELARQIKHINNLLRENEEAPH